MTNAPDYILVLEQQPSRDPQGLALLQAIWRSPLVIAHSTAQVLDSMRDIPPCLVILVGNHTRWPSQFSRQLRVEANLLGCTILALTDATAPSWPEQDDRSIFDGFLVKPLTSDVLTSVLQAAQARRSVAGQLSPEQSQPNLPSPSRPSPNLPSPNPPNRSKISAQSRVQSTGKSTI